MDDNLPFKYFQQFKDQRRAVDFISKSELINKKHLNSTLRRKKNTCFCFIKRRSGSKFDYSVEDDIEGKTLGT